MYWRKRPKFGNIRPLVFLTGIPAIFCLLLTSPLINLQSYYKSVINFESIPEIAKTICNTEPDSTCYYDWGKDIPDELWNLVQGWEVNEIIISETNRINDYWMLVVSDGKGYIVNLKSGAKWQPNSILDWNKLINGQKYTKISYNIINNKLEQVNGDDREPFIDEYLISNNKFIIQYEVRPYILMGAGILLSALIIFTVINIFNVINYPNEQLDKVTIPLSIFIMTIIIYLINRFNVIPQINLFFIITYQSLLIAIIIIVLIYNRNKYELTL